jgi:hypothetical protein
LTSIEIDIGVSQMIINFTLAKYIRFRTNTLIKGDINQRYINSANRNVVPFGYYLNLESYVMHYIMNDWGTND